MTERFGDPMLKASNSAEGKLALRFWHKGTNHCVVPQLSASHQDAVSPGGTYGRIYCVFPCLYISRGETSAAPFHGWGNAQARAGLNLHACNHTKLPTRGWGLHPPVQLLSPSKTRTGWQSLPLGQGLARLTSVPPHFKSALSCPSPGCSVKLLAPC